METGFRSLDGNMIRDLVLHCGNSHQVGQAVTILNDSCQEIREAARIQFRTHLFYLDYQHGETKANDVTWVAHLSPDRLNMIELLCKYWKGKQIYMFTCSDVFDLFFILVLPLLFVFFVCFLFFLLRVFPYKHFSFLLDLSRLSLARSH